MVERVNIYSAEYGWRPRPGARVEERGVAVSVNALGWRGPELARERGPRPRLVLLGDSMAFGHGVADDATFAARLAAAADGPEVINLGVEGYGPDQALLRFEREGRAYRPDAVLLSLCIDNDFADAGLPAFLYDGRYPKPWFSLEGDGLRLHDAHLRLGWRQRLGTWLHEHSQLYGRLVGLGRGTASPAPAGETWRDRRARIEADPDAAERVARLVLRLRAGARDAAPGGRAAALLVLLHPSKESYNRGSALLDALVARLARAGVETLDVGARFHALGLRFADFAFDPTGHLSAAGHARVAEELRAWRVRAARP